MPRVTRKRLERTTSHVSPLVRPKAAPKGKPVVVDESAHRRNATALVDPKTRTEKAEGGQAAKNRASLAAMKKANPELLKTVARFEREGGRGTWFLSVSPFGAGKPEGLYLVSALPAKSDPKSPVLLMRTDDARAFAAAMLARAPIVLAKLPVETQVGAAALGDGIQLAADAVKVAGAHVKSVMLLQPDASKYVAAHEFRHWQDFEDPALEKRFTTEMKPFFDAKWLPDDDKEFLLHMMWELRGHGAQQLQAAADRKAGVDVLDRAGNILPGGKASTKASLQFEESDANGIFNQAYESPIFRLLDVIRRHDKADVKKLAQIFADFEIKGSTLSLAHFAR